MYKSALQLGSYCYESLNMNKTFFQHLLNISETWSADQIWIGFSASNIPQEFTARVWSGEELTNLFVRFPSVMRARF